MNPRRLENRAAREHLARCLRWLAETVAESDLPAWYCGQISERLQPLFAIVLKAAGKEPPPDARMPLPEPGRRAEILSAIRPRPLLTSPAPRRRVEVATLPPLWVRVQRWWRRQPQQQPNRG